MLNPKDLRIRDNADCSMDDWDFLLKPAPFVSIALSVAVFLLGIAIIIADKT